MNPAHQPSLFNKRREHAKNGISIRELVLKDWHASKAASGDGIFVSYVSEDQIETAIKNLVEGLSNGDDLPLAGLTFTVKDNIDVDGIVTSSNCPGFGSIPTQSSTAVIRAQDAGAILIGKTTMDQFATGLNGTRSPEPLCRNSIDPDYIPGGSSSGSGVSVAKELCSFSLGSDTGGSGRVPAAANGIIGLKPTIGLISATGMVYCNQSFDCVPIFTKYSADAFEILDVLSGYDEQDPYSRTDADYALVQQTSLKTKRLAVPQQSDLHFFGDNVAAEMFSSNIDHFKELSFEIVEVDFSAFAEAGDMVFKSPLVAERLVDYGQFIHENPDAVLDPVRQAITNGKAFSASDLYVTLHRLEELRQIANKILSEVDALVVPTIPRLYKIDDMLANPMELNNVMGTYTYFANPLDLCAVAVPGKQRPDGLVSSICFNAPAGHDGILKTLAGMFEKSS
jgi:allophanate hydrolase